MSQHQIFAKRSAYKDWLAPRLCASLLGVMCATGTPASAQQSPDENLAIRVRQLTEAMNQAQQRLDESQRQIEQLRTELSNLQRQMAQGHGEAANAASAAQLSAAVEQIREQQSLEEAQIATHEQAKVESESKYTVKVNGLVLLTGFVDTTATDDPVDPTLALEGSGSTGAALKQTVLGIDARGPHVFNARSRADLRVDFDGASASGATSNSYGAGLIRLRTAHASLDWKNAQAFFSLDHAIVAPNTPTSLTAVAVPALSWSGNLWTWNPQVGMSADLPVSERQRVRLQTAMIDVINSPQIYSTAGVSSTPAQPSTSEMSRRPGVEGRAAVLGGEADDALQVGFGGLYIPHRSGGGTRFNSWAGTIDYRVPVPGRSEFSGNGYWGQALGGLGGGAFKDYVYRFDPLSPSGYSFRTLDAYGGWAQWKQRANENLEFNLAFGTDQVPAKQLRPYSGSPSSYYLNLARNRTFTGNVIYRASAYLLFSLEYRHLLSSPVNYYTVTGDVIGIATGYRF